MFSLLWEDRKNPKHHEHSPLQVRPLLSEGFLLSVNLKLWVKRQSKKKVSEVKMLKDLCSNMGQPTCRIYVVMRTCVRKCVDWSIVLFSIVLVSCYTLLHALSFKSSILHLRLCPHLFLRIGRFSPWFPGNIHHSLLAQFLQDYITSTNNYRDK